MQYYMTEIDIISVLISKNEKIKITRGSQEPVIAHLANRCQDKEHIKTIRSNILPKSGSNFFNEFPIGWFVTTKFRCSSHVGWLVGSLDIMLKDIHLVTIKFGFNWISYSRKKNIFNEILIGSYVKLSLAEGAILVGKWGQQI